jgi:hypothetical protein
MAAIGCLLPFALMLLGAAIGQLAGSAAVGYWGMGIGFLVGGVLAGLAFRLFARAGGR